MAGRPKCRNKAAFSNFSCVVCTGPGTISLPLDVKCGTFATFVSLQRTFVTHFWVSANFVGDKGVDR